MQERFEYFKEMYYKELESKELLMNRFTTNLTIVTILMSALIYCIQNINDLKQTIFFWPLSILGIISLILNLLIIVFLLIHIYGKNYGFIPNPLVLNNRFKYLENYYSNYPSQNTDAESHFKNEIYDYYVEAAAHNYEVNEIRTATMGTVNRLIILSVISTLLTVSCYVPSFFKDDANTQKVEIIKKQETNIQKDRNTQEIKTINNGGSRNE
ncbi:hypothetical protein SAMN05444673_4054 [Bacillus sp. OV166]|uniref:hypothetical protein n=1 Tax=Bacillus sp. OV166 TaxID=1882763 RepID=UPI000A2AD446|nr:hypothetical protein [Bacillus sp. OV166]SMQ80950.1 hypothetical protein SAMN05444673_4054 [Bacillus sp. OV166]